MAIVYAYTSSSFAKISKEEQIKIEFTKNLEKTIRYHRASVPNFKFIHSIESGKAEKIEKVLIKQKYTKFNVGQTKGDGVYRYSCVACYWYDSVKFNKEISKENIES